MFPANQVPKVARDSVKTGLGIIIKDDQWFPGEPGDFILQFFHEDSIWGTATLDPSMRAGLNQAFVITIVEEFPPFDP